MVGDPVSQPHCLRVTMLFGTCDDAKRISATPIIYHDALCLLAMRKTGLSVSCTVALPTIIILYTLVKYIEPTDRLRIARSSID